MRLAARPALVVSVALAACVGCFNFGSVSGGTADGGPDSGNVPEGGGGEGGGGVDGGGSFCASLSPTPTFCDDFDEATSPTGWDQIIQNNGAVTVDSLLAFSKPGSMLAETSAAVGGQQTEADVLKQFASLQGKAIQISASFEMNVQTWDPSSSGQILAFEIIFKNSSSTFNQIVLNLNSLGASGVSAQIAENAQGADGGEAGYNSYPLSTHPPTKTWTKVEVDLVIASPTSAASNVITVKLDGATQLSQQALQVPLQGGSPWVHMGIGYVATPAGAWAVRFDDLVVDIKSL
jgi:hypothetical protein